MARSGGLEHVSTNQRVIDLFEEIASYRHLPCSLLMTDLTTRLLIRAVLDSDIFDLWLR